MMKLSDILYWEDIASQKFSGHAYMVEWVMDSDTFYRVGSIDKGKAKEIFNLMSKQLETLLRENYIKMGNDPRCQLVSYEVEDGVMGNGLIENEQYFF